MAAGRVKSGATGRSGTVSATSMEAGCDSGAVASSIVDEDEPVVSDPCPHPYMTTAIRAMSAVVATDLRILGMVFMGYFSTPVQGALVGCSLG